MTTYFHHFTKDNGAPIVVEYSATGGEDNYDHPGHICDGGGSAPEVVILNSWPDDHFHMWLAEQCYDWKFLEPTTWWETKRARIFRWLWGVAKRADSWWRASLSQAEDERICAYIAEHHVDEPYEEDYR